MCILVNLNTMKILIQDLVVRAVNLSHFNSFRFSTGSLMTFQLFTEINCTYHYCPSNRLLLNEEVY